MSLSESFSRLCLKDIKTTSEHHDPMIIDDDSLQYFANAADNLIIVNNDIYDYIINVKRLRNEWFKLNGQPETLLYIMLSSGLSSSYPDLVSQWQEQGFPSTIYQFEYQVFRYFDNRETKYPSSINAFV